MILVVPFCNKDAVLQAKNLEWILQLDGKTGRRCMIAWEEGTHQDHVNRIRSIAKQAFSDVHDFSYPEATNKHWPAGANWAWQNVARYMPMAYTNNESWFWLEADAVPLKQGWLDALEQEYVKGQKPFMGHIVTEMGHMNGVAAYPNAVHNYCWKPLLVENAAWDVALKEETIEKTHNANHLIQHCWGLASNDKPQWRGDDPVASFRDTGHMLRIIEPQAVLFHRCKDGSLIDCLHAMQKTGGRGWQETTTSLIDTELLKSFKEEPQAVITSNTGSTTIFNIVEGGPLHLPATSGYSEVVGPMVPFPKTEIFIVTYFKDAEWLKYSLYSIKKFARGFTGVTVVCPDRDIDTIEPVCREWGPDNTTIEMYEEVEGKGMIQHQGMKCSADLYCQSEYILHTDSDCIFIEPVTPADYFVDGKPVLLKERYERFKDKHPTILLWKQHSEHALGFECPFETMRRHPAVHPRFLYSEARRRVEKKHGMEFMNYVLSRKPDFPQGISEFNLLGGFAHAMYPDRYHWIDTGETLAPKDKILQMWSHGGLDRPMDTGPWPGETPRSILKRILGV